MTFKAKLSNIMIMVHISNKNYQLKKNFSVILIRPISLLSGLVYKRLSLLLPEAANTGLSVCCPM